MTRLALPVIVAQVGMVTLGVVDIAMMGRVSSHALAAVALGHLYIFGLIVFCIGTLLALDPLISQAVGAGDRDATGTTLQRGLVVATILSVPAVALGWPAEFLLQLLGQPAHVIPDAVDYVHASLPGILPFLWFVALRQSLQAHSRTAPIVWTVLIANLANLGLDWVMIFGNLGFPAMHARGCALATTIGRWLMFVLLLLMALPKLRGELWPLRREALRRAPLLSMFRLGLPLGMAQAIEYGAFMATALMMGVIGERAIAGHQIAINLASLSFMVPLGLSSAAAVRVGYAVGRRDRPGVARAAGTALVGGAAMMVCFGTVFLALPGTLGRLYSNQEDVLSVAVQLIPLAGMFQISDGIQVVASGILRGLGRTRTPMLVHLVGFWVIGLPLGGLLAFAVGMGPRGLWWGLVAGLTVAAVALLWSVHRAVRRGSQAPYSLN